LWVVTDRSGNPLTAAWAPSFWYLNKDCLLSLYSRFYPTRTAWALDVHDS
jgi:hypothetical protein